MSPTVKRVILPIHGDVSNTTCSSRYSGIIASFTSNRNAQKSCRKHRNILTILITLLLQYSRYSRIIASFASNRNIQKSLYEHKDYIFKEFSVTTRHTKMGGGNSIVANIAGASSLIREIVTAVLFVALNFM